MNSPEKCTLCSNVLAIPLQGFPYFHSETVFGYKIENSISDAVSDSDAVLLITGHDEFDDFNFDLLSGSMNKPILVDCTGKIDPQNIKSEGVIFRGIGRGGL